MAKSGLRHIDVGSDLTKTEWESEESHEIVHGASFPASPVERQLFYRDDEHKWYIYDGTEWVSLQGGGVEIHGNEYHDPDFATESGLTTHEAATTGVHGVGSDYIAKSSVAGLDLADHKARHKYLGADEPDLLSLFLSRLTVSNLKHWANDNGFTQANSGSGSITLGWTKMELDTGTTQDSKASIYSSESFYFHSVSSRRHYVQLRFYLPDVASSQVMYFGLFATPASPSDTQKHIGWKISGDKLYASNADGTTQKTTEVKTLSQHNQVDLYFENDVGAGEVRFYVDHVLAATHSTNIPTTSTACYLLIYITNTTTSRRRVRIYPVGCYQIA